MLVSVKKGPEGSDEELLLALAAGDDTALGPLYRRYVPTVFKIAAESLGRDAAEDIVQEVFASVWKNAETFDRARGPVRPWIVQIARSRVLNELRRRSRKPESGEERDASALQELPDGASPPDQAVWEEYRRSAIQKAIGTLAPPQRQALSLAFFEDLTHEQVAETLKVPLGTMKTRIRSGIQQLRIALAAMAAVLVAVVATRFAFQYSSEQARETRSEAALRMVTASDTQVVRLVATPNAPPAAHGNYRTTCLHRRAERRIKPGPNARASGFRSARACRMQADAGSSSTKKACLSLRLKSSSSLWNPKAAAHRQPALR